MLDGTPEGTGDASLEAAQNAIAGLLSDPEEKPTREAPRKPAPAKPVVEAADPEGEEQPEQTPPEGESEDDEQQETPKPEPRKLRVKVDGEELELPEDEVVKGYSRTEDYTRKTQKLAEERKAFQTEAEAVRAERQRYATQLGQLEEVLKTSGPAEPDWDKLRDGDPAVFAATYAAWDQHTKRIAAVAAERTRAEEKVRQDQIAAHQNTLRGEHDKLLEALPAWKDPEVAKKEKSDLADYARSRGYSDDELAAVSDHRVIKILRDAMMFDKMQKNKPALEKKVEDAKVVAPGPTGGQKAVSELTRRKQALAKTGRTDDAAAAIALLLD